MRPISIRGGRIVDPSQKLDSVLDLLLVDGAVAEIGENLGTPDDCEVIDASGFIVSPGLIDVHVHLREPGGEHKETIASGARAAAAGGFTAVIAMPNTDPPIDDPATVGFVVSEGLRSGGARVYPTGCITVEQKSLQLTEFGEMIAAGAVAVTDDGRPVTSASLMRMALEYALAFDLPVAVHAEELELSRGGSMNEGVVATRLGLTGIPNAAEDVMIARDLMLAELTGGRLHIQHVSTRYGVEMIRQAKARGVRVTAEGSPHHFTLTDEAVDPYETNAKMNPPLRSSADRDAVRDGVCDGTLCIIATDHAPHHYDEKEQAFEDAPNGIVGLETALGVSLTELVHTGRIDISTLIERMSCTPARAFSIPGGKLKVGSAADITIFDDAAEWVVEPKKFLSMSRNTPFGGRTLRGRAVRTIVGGRTVWELASA
ncbi:MAG: dihydroorotase [Gemmatimonadetes bacterium]|nr:dihydroorotase [Gemmatimonadota bacterium]